MISNIKNTVEKYKKKYHSSDPFEIAGCLNIITFFVPLGNLSGFYQYMKRHKCIFINSDIKSENFRNLVMAHELGHAVLHTKENCHFMDSQTLLNTCKLEIQANQFAAELLISDKMILENSQLTTSQFARLLGYEEEFIKLRLKTYENS